MSIAGLGGALLRARPSSRAALQLAGACYLAALRVTVPVDEAPLPPATERAGVGPLSRGFLLVWSNPKALIFFGAVLPQFLRPDRSLGLQFLQLAATFLALELAVTTLAAAAADRLVSAGSGRALARVRGTGGLLLAGTAVFLALTALREVS